MRLSAEHRDRIRELVREAAGERAEVRLFGSRLRDDVRGGDLDLLVTVDEPVANPALLIARLEARISRAIGGRSVDVILQAPNLQESAIHRVAAEEGIAL
ncbi:MAG: nucleotidyltransferase domain-containing protein [Thiohalospira sp.]